MPPSSRSATEKTFQKRQVRRAPMSALRRPNHQAERLSAALSHPPDFLPRGSARAFKFGRPLIIRDRTSSFPRVPNINFRRTPKSEQSGPNRNLARSPRCFVNLYDQSDETHATLVAVSPSRPSLRSPLRATPETARQKSISRREIASVTKV